jgi:hypothetical protein
MPKAAALPRGQSTTLVLILCVVSIVVPLLVTPVLPFIDLYNHISRYWVIAHFDEIPELARSYIVAWRILPNLGLDLVGVVLLRFAEPLLASKLIVGLIFAIQLTSSLILSRTLGNRDVRHTALLVSILLYSFILNWGFLNFLLGTAISYLAIAAWFRFRASPLRSSIAGSILALIVFFCHGFAFFIYGLTLAMMEFGRWRQAGEPVRELVRGLLLLAIQAILPVALFAVSSTLRATAPVAQAAVKGLDGSSVAQRLGAEVVYRLTTIVRVAETPISLFDVLVSLVIATLVVVGLRTRRLRLSPVSVPALVMLLVLTVITPPSVLGVGFVADRLPYLAAMLFVVSLKASDDRPGPSATLVVLGAVLVLRTLVLIGTWYPYRDDWHSAQRVLHAVPRGALLAGLDATPVYRGFGEQRRCQMYMPLALPYFGARVPLFADPRQQPLALRGRLLEAASLPIRSQHWTQRRDAAGIRNTTAQLVETRRYDYLLACGVLGLDQPIKSASIVARDGRFTLFKLGAPPTR